MNASVSTTPAVRAFAAQVRAGLDDLPADEVEELTDGLEADLLEQAEDAGEDVGLGDPLAYADELRAAAGLPPRGRRAKARTRVLARLRTAGTDVVRLVRANPVGSRCLDFALAVRPVWWVARGWALFECVALPVGGGIRMPVGGGAAAWLALAACIVLSVQWGRGRWLPWRGVVALKVLVSAATLIVLPVLVVAVLSSGPEYQADDGGDRPTGMTLDGRQITNIFPYDGAGRQLRDVQLFDQDGRPLTTVGEVSPPVTYVMTQTGDGVALVPSSRASGTTGWNVFPLDRVAVPEDGEPDPATRVPVTPPFAQPRPLADPSVEDSPSPAPAP